MTNSTTMIDGGVGPIAVHTLAGEGDQVLLIAHATGFLGKVYQAFARELPSDLRVVALDFRGHGDSATPDNEDDFAWALMADDLARVIEHVGADSLHGFGHSMGGATVLEVERRAPGTFASAFVFEPIIPPGRFTADGESPLSKAARGRLRTFPSRGDALVRYSSKPPLGLFRADVLHDYVVHGFEDSEDGVSLKCLPESEASTFAHAGEIALDSLPEIDLDVVVAKSGDGGLPAKLADTVAEQLPNGRLLEFSAITHFGPLQDPITVAEAVKKTIAA